MFNQLILTELIPFGSRQAVRAGLDLSSDSERKFVEAVAYDLLACKTREKIMSTTPTKRLRKVSAASDSGSESESLIDTALFDLTRCVPCSAERVDSAWNLLRAVLVESTDQQYVKFVNECHSASSKS